MSSAKNELYEVTNCELEHVNGEYTYNSKVDCHVHASGKIHLYRTSKDYIWTIADSTRRKQFCFAQKIASHPTGCSWNVYTGGVGGELLSSGMRVFNNTEVLNNASPLKRISTKTSGKLSPMITTLKPGPKLTSDKVTPLQQPLTPVAPPSRPKASPATTSTEKKSTAESKISPGFKTASAVAAANAKQTIINISNTILGETTPTPTVITPHTANKGATVVRKASQKTLSPVQVSVEDAPAPAPAPSTPQPPIPSPRVSPKATFERVSSIDAALSGSHSNNASPRASQQSSPRPGSRLSMFESVLEMEVRVLQVESVDGSMLQVTIPAAALGRLQAATDTASGVVQSLPMHPLVEWNEVEAAWSDATLLLHTELTRAHHTITTLNTNLATTTADLEIVRALYEESQEQSRAYQEELQSNLALATAAQNHLTQLQTDTLDEANAENNQLQAALEDALQREKTALRAADNATERLRQLTTQSDTARAQARQAHDQAQTALQDKQVAEAIARTAQKELEGANQKIAALQRAADQQALQPAPVPAAAPPLPSTNTTVVDAATARRIEQLERSLQEKERELNETTVAFMQARKDHQRHVNTISSAATANNISTSSATINHIKRDAPTTTNNTTTTFPTGAEFVTLFTSETTRVETFLQDAAKCLEDSGYLDNAAEVLVHDVLGPLHEACHNCVLENVENKRSLMQDQWGVEININTDSDETVGKLFWYAALQPQLLSEINALQDSALHELVCSSGSVVVELAECMVTAKAAGVVSGVLTVYDVAHMLLRYFAIAALSQPRCVLYPAPGRHIPYTPHYTTEISVTDFPNNTTSAPLVAGEEVEVVFCGVYFERPSDGDFAEVRPVMPALVRRIGVSGVNATSGGIVSDGSGIAGYVEEDIMDSVVETNVREGDSVVVGDDAAVSEDNVDVGNGGAVDSSGTDVIADVVDGIVYAVAVGGGSSDTDDNGLIINTDTTTTGVDDSTAVETTDDK